MDDEKIVVLASLLHDIGKFYQRRYDVPQKKHEEYGADIVMSIPSLPKEIREKVAKIVALHHEKQYSGELENILNIVKRADRLSAEHDRIPGDTVDERINKVPMMSIFSEIIIEGYGVKSKKYVNLSQLSDKYEIHMPRDRNLAKSDRKLYEELFKDFDKVFRNIEYDHGKFNSFADNILYLLMKYTIFVPSAVYINIPDISLYDHLKTTAAIALPLLKGDKEKPFLLIMGEISGIQKYIFHTFRDEGTDKFAAKRLRGRSFLIHLVTDAVVEYIKREMSLYEFSVLWGGGGHFLILAPMTKENYEKIDNIRKNVNKYLLKNFRNLCMIICSHYGDDRLLENFSSTLKEMSILIDEAKKRKYSGLLEMLLQNFEGKHLCKICGVHAVDDEEEPCNICRKTEKIGEKLVKGGRYLLRKEGDGGIWKFTFGDFTICYDYSDNADETCDVFTISGTFLPKAGKVRGIKFISHYVPRVKDDILSVSELVNPENDIKKRIRDKDYVPINSPKLAILKSDVDNLGLIFSSGFRVEGGNVRTISRQSHLSFMLTYFYGRIIDILAEKHNIYVVFSGGDDLVILGRYDEVMKFAISLQDKFTEWVGNNKAIHLSGGIVIEEHKFPVRRLIDICDNELEDKAKAVEGDIATGKNSISIFGSVMRWDDYKEQIDIAEELFDKFREEKIPSGISHLLLYLHKHNPYSDPRKRGDRFIIPHPHIRYYFARRWKGESDDMQNFVSRITDEKIFKHINVAVSKWVLDRRWFK